MPIPFLLAGAAIATGVLGAAGHSVAKDTNEEAQRVARKAQNLYEEAKEALEKAQKGTEESLLKLGNSKKKTLDYSMKQFLQVYEKIKNVKMKDSIGLNEISDFKIEQQDVIHLRELTNVYDSAMSSATTGAVAGAAISLAVSGSLGLVAEGLSWAGTFLSIGEVGLAATSVGSALTLGLSATPLAAIAAPVALFTAFSASSKADENLEKAETMYAEAEVAAEKMKVSETICNAISERSEMFYDVLVKLDTMFLACIEELDSVIKEKEKRISKKRFGQTDFTDDDLKLIAVTRSLAGAIKAIIDTPILNKDGEVSNESQNICNQIVSGIPELAQRVEDVGIVNLQYIDEAANYIGETEESAGDDEKESEEDDFDDYLQNCALDALNMMNMF